MQTKEIKMKKRKQKEMSEKCKLQEMRISEKLTSIPVKKRMKNKSTLPKNDCVKLIENHQNDLEPIIKDGMEKIKKIKKDAINSISDVAKEALGRGGGKACVATHGHGCCHFGLLDLRGMDQKTFCYYSKDGAWLAGLVCISCDHKVKEFTQDKSTKNFVMYCEMGLKSFKMNKNGNDEEKKLFEDHYCDMVLCVSCWNKKVIVYDQEVKDKLGLNSRRCSSRKKI